MNKPFSRKIPELVRTYTVEYSSVILSDWGEYPIRHTLYRYIQDYNNWWVRYLNTYDILTDMLDVSEF